MILPLTLLLSFLQRPFYRLAKVFYKQTLIDKHTSYLDWWYIFVWWIFLTTFCVFLSMALYLKIFYVNGFLCRGKLWSFNLCKNKRLILRPLEFKSLLSCLVTYSKIHTWFHLPDRPLIFSSKMLEQITIY